MTTPGSINPQSASTPAESAIRADEYASLELTEKEATADQRILGIGNTIPLVFCRQEGGRGGAWVSPPAGLFGAIINPRDGDSFAFGMVVSDGKISAIAESDIYKGVYRFDKLGGKLSAFAYGYMPTSGFDFSLKYVEPGAPGIPGVPGDPGTPDIPGYWQNHQGSSNNSYSVSGPSQSYSRSWSDVVNINISHDDGVGRYFTRYSIYVNGSLVSQTGYQITSFPFTYSYSGGRATVTFLAETSPNSGNNGAISRALSASYTYQTWVPPVPGIPPTPGVPPTAPGADVISALPLFSGKAGTYQGTSCLTVASKFTDAANPYAYRQQVRCFVRNGIEVDRVLGGSGASNLFPDLAYYLLRKAHPASVKLIDLDSFKQAAGFCGVHKLWFNGVLASSVNLREYLIRTSKLFLLGFSQEQGLYRLKPLVPVNSDYSFNASTIAPEFVFNSDDIVAGSLNRTYLDTSRRQSVCALVTWRAQDEAVFGVNKSTEVRYTNTAIDGPYEQYDLTEFCVTPAHAVLIAKYILAYKKHVTHSVRFDLALNRINLAPLDIIQVELSLTNSLGSTYTDSTMYMVDAIQESQDGTVTVEATHFPVNDSGQSLVVRDMLGSYFTVTPEEN